MSTNLLNGSIYDYYGISDKLKAMNPKNDPYAENQWNYYTSIFGRPFSVDRIFGGDASFLESSSAYGITNPLDAVALGLWQAGLGKASGSSFLSYRSGVGNEDASLGSTLYSIADTHLDALNYDDKWLRTQAGAVMSASKALMPYVTKDNQDGTYNLSIGSGATGLGLSGLHSETSSWTEWEPRSGGYPVSYTRSSSSLVDGPSKTLNYENVKLFNDIDSAYNYVRNDSSFLYNIKKAALNRTATNTDLGPTGEQAQRGRANVATELNYAAENDLKSRRSKVDQYKRNKATSQRLSATSSGSAGVGGADNSDELKLGIPNLLGL